MQVSRRFFLFGAGAVAASAAITKLIPKIPFTLEEALDPAPVFRRRRVRDILFGAETDIQWDISRLSTPLTLRIHRAAERGVLFETAISPMAVYRWVAQPGGGGDLIFTPEHPMLIEMEGAAPDLPVKAVIHGADDDAWFCDTYTFPGGQCKRDWFEPLPPAIALP